MKGEESTKDADVVIAKERKEDSSDERTVLKRNGEIFERKERDTTAVFLP